MSRWTTAIEIFLVAQAATGKTATPVTAAINSAFGVNFSKDAILGKCKRLHIRLPRELPASCWNADTVAALREKVALKKTAVEIAAELNWAFGANFTKNSVIGKCHRLNIDLLGGPESMQGERPYRRTPGSAYSRYGANPKLRPKRKRIYRTPVSRKTSQDKAARVITLMMGCDAIEASTSVTLRELEENQCHWPLVSRSASGEQLYCGAPKLHGCYCTMHLQAKNKSRLAA